MGPHEKVAVVLPSEASVSTPAMALDAGTVDQPAAFAGLEAGQGGHRDAAAGGSVEPHDRCAASRCPGAGAMRRADSRPVSLFGRDGRLYAEAATGSM